MKAQLVESIGAERAEALFALLSAQNPAEVLRKYASGSEVIDVTPSLVE